jgi:hypothetical protein
MITVHDDSLHVTIAISQLEDPAALRMAHVRPTTKLNSCQAPQELHLAWHLAAMQGIPHADVYTV